MDTLLLGVLSGAVAGLVPGVGVTVSLILLYPFYFSLPLDELFIFYIALASTTQFMGSVSATILGIPGEGSSIPAVKEGNTLFKKGLGSYAISGAALGSLLGAFLTMALIVAISPLLQYLVYFFSSYLQGILLLGVIALLVITSSNRIIISLLIMGLAWFLGSVGCAKIMSRGGDCFLVYDNPDLSTGLPFLSVIGAIYVFPQLLKDYGYSKATASLKTESFIKHFKYFIKNISSAVRGTFIGFFVSLMPGAGVAASSMVAYKSEINIEKKKGTYEEGNYNALVSAETANNAAIFASLLPLFVIGIPLSGSELIFYNTVLARGGDLESIFNLEYYIASFAKYLILINFLGLLLAWPFAKYVKYLYYIPQKYINIGVFCLLTFVIYTFGTYSFQGEYFVLVFLSLLPIGYLLRNYDTLPFLFIFLLQDRLYALFFTLGDLFASWT